ncbi:retrovirus-related pol polyprotein from transposon TNT 1-94 [Tanacetum coccineum]
MTIRRTVGIRGAVECWLGLGKTVGMQRRKPKRSNDSTVNKERCLLCKQAEKGVQLQAEQSDWLADTDEEIDEQEWEAHYSYMAKIQEVPNADSGTDAEPLEQWNTRNGQSSIDLKYVESLIRGLDELESGILQNFPTLYDLLLQECVSKDVRECDCLAQKLSEQTEFIVQLILFIVDSGCTKHMTGNLSLLCNFVEKYLGTVRFGNDQFAPILGYGDLVQGNITIKRVYYVEGLNHNLFSGNELLTGNRGADLYTISLQETTSSTPICLMAKASPTQAWLWHRRLSHLNFDYINLLSKKDVVIGLPKLKYVKDQLCSSCEALIMEVKQRYFEDYYSDYQYAISIKEDTAYPCLHSSKTTKDTRPIRRIQERQYAVFKIYGNKIFWKISNVIPTPRNSNTPGEKEQKRSRNAFQSIGDNV